MHFLWLISAGEGYELLQGAAHKGLKGLKIAPFYGCQILRPSKLLGFEDPDKPESLERIITACGGEPIDYPAKIKCCGFPIIQAREDVALAELIQPIEQAKEAGADAMVTPCPLCHLSLDAWQSKLHKQTGKDFQMPILHLSQLVGVAAGIDSSELKFKRHVVSVAPVTEKLSPSDLARVGLVMRARSARRGCDRGLGRGSRRAGYGSALWRWHSTGLPPVLDGLRIAHLLRSAPRGARSEAGRRSPTPSSGWSSASPTSCASRAISSRAGRESRSSSSCWPGSGAATSCSAITTSPTAETPSRSASTATPSPRFAGVAVLTDESVTVEARGHRIEVVGVDPRTYARRDARPHELIDESIELKILLCHFPGIVRRIPPVFQLVLSGHLHAGQIVVPYPGGKLRLAHLRARDVEGLYDYGTTTLHVSPGLGTTFVPFRLFARPEVTELVVRST